MTHVYTHIHTDTHIHIFFHSGATKSQLSTASTILSSEKFMFFFSSIEDKATLLSKFLFTIELAVIKGQYKLEAHILQKIENLFFSEFELFLSSSRIIVFCKFLFKGNK